MIVDANKTYLITDATMGKQSTYSETFDTKFQAYSRALQLSEKNDKIVYYIYLINHAYAYDTDDGFADSAAMRIESEQMSKKIIAEVCDGELVILGDKSFNISYKFGA